MLHAHCEGCVSRHCNVRGNGVDSCPVVPCEQGCSARYHQCLQSEHTLLCPEERVSCINAVNGCPLIMVRRKLASHLEVCPASVLCCPTEWNRWPMHSKEDGKKMPVPSCSRYIMCGQLDVALAMRDQRMLIQTLNAPKKTKRIMRNSLTTRYPAAPFSHRGASMESDVLTSEENSRNVSDDDCDVPWNLGQYPPGLQRSVCSRLIRATKQATESLTVTLDLVSNHLSGQAPSCSNSSLEELCKGPDGVDGVDDMQESAGCADGSLPIACGLCKPQSKHVHSVQCMTGFHNGSLPQAEVAEPEEPQELVDNLDCLDSKPINEDTKLHELLGVDINIDCITRYQPKPAEMYTFLCAQEFRRDEFAWHYKNVHVDLQSCFNGWMEQRCPLAHRGCTFSFRRFQPRSNGAHITHSYLSESFGLVLNDLPQVKCLTNKSAEPNACCDTHRTDDTVIPQSGLSPNDIRHARSVDVTNSNVSSLVCDTMETSCLSDVASTPLSFNASDYDYHHNDDDDVDLDNDGAKDVEIDVSGSSVVSQQSHTSLVAEDNNNVIVFTSQRAYSPILLCTVQDSALTDVNSDLFMKLPFEVLRHVARHLDSFSLRNLALTSRLLRDVCCSLLNERGIVTTTWRKTVIGLKVSWQPAGRVWQFSTSFSPVEQWHFSGDNPVSEHLKVCPFNQELNVHAEPFQVGPPFIAESDNKLKDLLAQRQRDSVSMRLRELGNLQACHMMNNC
ncbi:F-box only protein 30-like [Gigantopelta aegis]|uniref:F-box only protein 30-like n=1 Tax=Gigantopelta aegis TaxID=1735272 RepID=UPI001B88D066|nr:F-box only protein 30-like [Gigantopelta aegis]XP_041366371.1 F-box only protein 30-like [Gigantopelta aegis]XP_041366372.1 F-box only protein 30-like [Gigantopelta aegis]